LQQEISKLRLRMEALDLSFLRKQLTERRSRLETSARNLPEPVKIYRLLQQIDRAIERLDKGSFGICEVCHDPIEAERLAYDPMITVCLDHLSKEQRHALEEDLELASKIQKGLLPQPKISVNGWEFGFRYKPAGIVSGDFCDFIPLSDDTSFFVLGDVSGKGISASLMMSQLHALTRSFLTFGLPLDEIVRRTNRLFCESILSNNYATMVFGKASSNGEIELCIAGHNPPMILKEKEIMKVKANGIPVGLFCNSEYSISKYTLEPGDTLLTYTDGLTESLANEKEYGEQRLLENFLKTGHQSSEFILDNLFNDYSSFMNGIHPADDVTLAILKKI
jgi:sigma-B regulation protein RsbU (phosphoserine phosphatase)